MALDVMPRTGESAAVRPTWKAVTMALTISSVAFDCDDALALARFWAAVTGWDVWDGSDETFAAVGGPNRPADTPRLLFNQVPEAKMAKNRCHLDLHAEDLDAEVRRLVDLGATQGDQHEWGTATWRVMQDPSGNEFCVVVESNV